MLPGDNAAKAVKAIQILTDWRNAGFTPEQTEYPASVALFSAGDAAFHFNGVWEVPTFTDLHAKGALGDWSATVIPPLLDQPATWADSHAFAIPQQAGKEMTPEKRKAVMEVIGWMEKNAHPLGRCRPHPGLPAGRDQRRVQGDGAERVLRAARRQRRLRPALDDRRRRLAGLRRGAQHHRAGDRTAS